MRQRRTRQGRDVNPWYVITLDLRAVVGGVLALVVTGLLVRQLVREIRNVKVKD